MSVLVSKNNANIMNYLNIMFYDETKKPIQTSLLCLFSSYYLEICFLILIFAENIKRYTMESNEKIVIENPPKKVLDFIEKMRKTKEVQRKELLDKKTHNFSIQL